MSNTKMRQTHWKSLVACSIVFYLLIQGVVSLSLQKRLLREEASVNRFFLPSAVGIPSDERRLALAQQTPGGIIVPTSDRSAGALRALSVSHPEIKFLKVLQHGVYKSNVYKSSQSIRSEKVNSEFTEIFAQTDKGVIKFNQEIWGSDPFKAKEEKSNPLMEIEGTSKSETLIPTLEFIQKHRLGRNFLSYLAGEDENHVVPDSILAAELYVKYAQYLQEQEQPLQAIEGPSSPSKVGALDEIVKDPTTETKRIAAALWEQDVAPLRPLPTLISQETQNAQPVVNFKDFEIMLKHRARLDRMGLKEFKEWVNDQHKVSLESVKDEDRFDLVELYYNFVLWVKENRQIDPKHFKQLPPYQYAVLLAESSSEEPLFGELLELHLSPAERKHFRANFKNFGDDTIFPIDRFKSDYDNWKKSSKPLAYHVDRFLEVALEKTIASIRRVWERIRSHAQAFNAIVRKKWANLFKKKIRISPTEHVDG